MDKKYKDPEVYSDCCGAPIYEDGTCCACNKPCEEDYVPVFVFETPDADGVYRHPRLTNPMTDKDWEKFNKKIKKITWKDRLFWAYCWTLAYLIMFKNTLKDAYTLRSFDENKL
jgi:hypothetical protein